MNFTPRHTDLRPHFNFERARTRITVADSPAVVAWYVRVSTFSFSRLLHSVNGGSNPAWDRKNRVDARWIKRRVYTGHGLRRVFLLIKRRRLCIARGVHMCVLYKFWTRKYQIFPWENLNQTPKRERQAHILSKTNNGPNKTCKTPSQTRLITLQLQPPNSHSYFDKNLLQPPTVHYPAIQTLSGCNNFLVKIERPILIVYF